MHDWRAQIRQRLRSFDLEPAVEADIVEELAQHLEDHFRDRSVDDGEARDEVRRVLAQLDVAELRGALAARGLSPVVQVAPLGAAWSGRDAVDALRRDLTFGWRSLWRTRGATIAIVASLAIVIGANCAIFGLVDAMFLRRLPLPHVEQLTAITPVSDGHPLSVPYAAYKQLASSAGMPPMEAYRFEGVSAATPAGDRVDLWLDLVTGGYFKLLGVKPLFGRLLSAQDERSAAPVAVVSAEYWKQHLGGSRDVLGQTLELNDLTVTIVGVTAPSFTGLYFARPFQIAVPFTISPSGFTDVSPLSAELIARTGAPGRGAAEAAGVEAAFRACCAQTMGSRGGSSTQLRNSSIQHVAVDDPPFGIMATQFPAAGQGVHVVLHDASHGLTWGVDYRGRYRAVLFATMVAVFLLLLIACANVATLLLARGEARERELAVRRSLGASALRIKVQLLVEGLELAAMGAVLGFALAAAGTKLLLRELPASAAPLGTSIAWHASGVVVGFTLLIMLVCAIVTSLIPAQRAGREELLASLTGARRLTVRGWGLDRSLVVVQVTLAIILATGAGLYVSTVHNLVGNRGGYASRNVLLVRINADQSIDDQALMSTYAALAPGAARLPGVERAALTFNAPVLQDAMMMYQISLPGSRDVDPVGVRTNFTSPGFFSATGIGLASGRDFGQGDDANAPPVVIVSQAFERQHYGERSALGQAVIIDDRAGGRTARIVGVARNASYDRMQGTGTNLRDLESEVMYAPLSQALNVPIGMTLILRTAGNPLELATPVRRLIGEQHGVSVYRLSGLAQLLDDAASRERFAAALATGFGLIALVLTGVGIFGVLWFQVARRTREIGVRMALGARAADAIWLVVRQTLGMLAVAAVLGIPLAIAAARVVRAQLYGISPTDPWMLLGSAGLLVLVGLVSSVVPSVRAARVDPLVALREEG